ncbi:hypothetical protein [Helicobacter suis]|nr:hypothetical protein [Helicobacter suis]
MWKSKGEIATPEVPNYCRLEKMLDFTRIYMENVVATDKRASLL